MVVRREFVQQGLMAGGALSLTQLGTVLAQENTVLAQENAVTQKQSDASMDVGILIFPNMDQIDFTGPFEVLSRIPGAAIHVVWKEKKPVRDIKGLILTPELTLGECPPLDILVIPGGPGQQPLMEDEPLLSFVRDRAAQAKFVYSVCTGALICGAAGLLKGVKSTTHWASFELLKYFGAIPTDKRVVLDGKHLSAAGVTAGIDGALTLASVLCGDRVAQQIQLGIEYAPEPPFNSGTPKVAPPDILESARAATRKLTEERAVTARRIAAKLGVAIKD